MLSGQNMLGRAAELSAPCIITRPVEGYLQPPVGETLICRMASAGNEAAVELQLFRLPAPTAPDIADGYEESFGNLV
jgi:hypothetical protein